MSSPYDVAPPLITETIALSPDISDPLPGTDDYALMAQRHATGRRLAALPWVPQGNDEWAREIYDKVDLYERRFVAPDRIGDEYVAGTAQEDDEVGSIEKPDGSGTFLFTAEHATSPGHRVAGSTYPDTGTAGLAALLAVNHGAALIMTGRQTGNAPVTAEHPIKDAMGEWLPSATGFLSVHGMGGGKLVRLEDTSEVQAVIGLGANPSEASMERAERLVKAAHDLGLYAIIGNRQNYYVQKGDPEAGFYLRRNDDGAAYINTLAAKRSTSTTSVASEIFRQNGNKNAPAMQIELTNLLRLTPEDWNKKDKPSLYMSVALGYKLMELAVLLDPPNELASTV
jgi:hypothetical protein